MAHENFLKKLAEVPKVQQRYAVTTLAELGHSRGGSAPETVVLLNADETCPSKLAAKTAYVRYTRTDGLSVTGFLAGPEFNCVAFVENFGPPISRVVLNARNPRILDMWLGLAEVTSRVTAECCQAMAANAPPTTMSAERRFEFAVKTMEGSATLALERRPAHFASLKDSVAAPGGLTIRGLHQFRRNGFQGAVMDQISMGHFSHHQRK